MTNLRHRFAQSHLPQLQNQIRATLYHRVNVPGYHASWSRKPKPSLQLGEIVDNINKWLLGSVGIAVLIKQKHPIRAARLLALAHDIQIRIEAGEFKDYADVARHHQLTRARLTQIMNLLPLAPDIQEEILAMEAETGREPVGARDLRKVLRSMNWGIQRVFRQQISYV